MKQKILIVGDLHGRLEALKIAIDKFIEDKYDKIVFIGDYTDSFVASNDEILEVVQLVIYLKERYGDKVILLLGNHDIQYMYFPDYRCSGFRPEIQTDLTELFNKNKQLFQIAHYEGDNDKKNYLFTHAGIQLKWYIKYIEPINFFREKYDLKEKNNIAELINCLNEVKQRSILFEVGTKRGGMRYDYGGPLWCDKEEIESYGPIPNCHQIVGHTPIQFIEKVTKFEGDKYYNNTSVTFIDVLKDNKEPTFLTLEI